MGLGKKLVLLSGVVLAVYVGIKLNNCLSDPPVPNYPTDFWWGPGEKKPVDETTRPFTIQVPNQVLTDLEARLTRFLETPYNPPFEGVGFEYGFNPDFLYKVVKHWRDNYDWRSREKYLNTMPQFTTYVNGLKVHFIRVTPKAAQGKRILPLLILHGWPGSVREFYDIIPILTQPNKHSDFIFEVIAPSLPGFGFSDGPARPGMGHAQMAVVMKNFMSKIGINKFYVQGGDWGSAVAKSMATLYPDAVMGLHSNLCLVTTPMAQFINILGSLYPRLIVDEEHEHMLYPISNWIIFLIEESGYFHMQGTKPYTIGAALQDSPAGLLAYLLDKVSIGTNKTYKSLPDGGLTEKYPLDTWLDNVMIYWVSRSITSTFNLYVEHFTFKQMAYKMDSVPVKVPSACARFYHEMLWQPEMVLKLAYRNLVQVTDYKSGGHFAALENPKILADDIITAVFKMEKLSNKTVS